MRKVLATVAKEWLLLKRDIGGFMLLFIMPAMLIIVMALVQDGPFRDYQEVTFDLLLSDNDKGSLAEEIRNGLKQGKHFHLIETVDGKQLDDERLKELLHNGKYQVGIIIPRGATAEVANSANIITNSISEKLGMGSMPVRETRDSAYIRLYFDPLAKPTFRLSISNALDKYITYSCSNLLVKRISKMGSVAGMADTSQTDFKKIFSGVGIREVALNDKWQEKQYINSVQHNVPAWAIFGMFFIAIPMAAQTIRERTEGSSLRLELIPGVYRQVAMGRILFYTLVCTAQFIAMFCVGLWILPFFGLSKLYLGLHPVALLPVALCISFAATSFGHFTGAVFQTVNQALPFGAITIILLSAIGGVWVPVELLPEVMRKIAVISPLYWGLDAIHELIIRNNGIHAIWENMLILLAFGTLLWLASTLINRKRRYSF